MRRRPKTTSKPVKARSRKAKTPKAARHSDSSVAGRETEVARLARELHETQEQQTATAEVLKIISASRTELQPVLDVVVRSAARYCKADDVTLFELDGEDLREAAHWGSLRHGGETFRFPCTRGSVAGRVVLERKPIHVIDLQAETENFPEGSALARRFGHRTIASVALLSEGVAVGTLQIRRTEVKPFTDKQIALLETFAAQAVIAIENARLLNELRQRTDDLTESLEQQTGTSEVLKVISSSPGQLEPVFQAMLENATRLCEAKFGTLVLAEGGGRFRVAAMHNAPLEWAGKRTREPVFIPGPLNNVAIVAKTKKVQHVSDLRLDPSYLEREPAAMALADIAGARTLVVVPMLKENELIGVFGIYRDEVRPFTDKQIALLANFANQAVIAIENARLLDDLNKLNQQLEQRVTDQVEEIERMSRLRRFLPPQVADLIVASGTEKQLESHRREITALFCDLRGFTGFSESSDPEDVMALLAEYHAAIGTIINKYSGTLERYAGDGVMVIFNDPVPVENPALQAVLMALEMRNAIEALMQKWRLLGHDIGFGIGIAHGFATLGTIGFEGRRDYAAIGTVSNVASRLCDEAKPSQILISPRVLLAVDKAVSVEQVGEFALKGIRRPMQAYNVLQSKSN